MHDGARGRRLQFVILPRGASMKIKKVCHLPFFAQEPSASLERTGRTLGQRTRQRPTLRRALAADRATVCQLLRSRFAFGWRFDCYLKRILLYRACILKDTYICILLYPDVSQMYLKSSVFFRKEILNGNRRRNMTTVLYSVVACLASEADESTSSRRRSSGAHGDALNI